jgi:hypothetical protein
MLQEPSPSEPHVALAATPAAGAAGAADAAVGLPRLSLHLRLPVPRVRVTLGPAAGRIAIGALVAATFAVVADAAAGPSVLVPRSVQSFPTWESGPLHIIPRLIDDPRTVGLLFSAVMLIMLIAYGVVLGSLRSLSMRTIVIAVVVLHAILLLSPPLQLTDMFNYLGYARLGGLHGLNPYTHGINQEYFDPVYRFSSWRNLYSPYGPLFTALSYPLALMPLAGAYWTVKVATVALSLVFLVLVWHCARRLGRDPRFAVAFVALNPLYLIYEVAGFHNDFFMLAPMMGAIALMLARRDRSAGAVLMLAVAVKFTAILMLPFLLVAAHRRRRQIRVLVGAALGSVPLAALSLALFGFTLPNLSDQSTLLTSFSVPNLIGDLARIGGGTPGLLKLAAVCVVLVVAHQFYRNRDWLAGAGWSTVALIASLSWLMPWYVVWLLPLAAIAGSVRLRRMAIVLTVFLAVTFMPAVSQFDSDQGIQLLSGSAGRAATTLQHKLSS